MPLPLPQLDDRRWVDLSDQGRGLIPRYAPDWTDFNVHDPGITLVELFAYLTEARIFQANQIPERHKWKFLELAGFHPTGPRAAAATLVFGPFTAATSFDLPAGVEFRSAGSPGVPVAFTTLSGVHLARVTLSALQADDGSGVLKTYSRDLREGLPIVPFGPDPQPGCALYVGFDDLPTAVPVSLGFWFAPPGNDDAERDRTRDEMQKQLRECGHVLPHFHCPGGPKPPEPVVPETPPHHSARIVWEVYTGAPGNPWVEIKPLDRTRSLTLDGIVEIVPPATMVRTILGAEPASLFYIRERLAAGRYDAPVIVLNVLPNAVEVRQQARLWQALPIAKGVVPVGAAPSPGSLFSMNFTADSSGILQSLSFLAAGAGGAPVFTFLEFKPPTAASPGKLSIDGVLAGVGTGVPEQLLTLPHSSVQQRHFRLYSHSGAAWTHWTRHQDFDAAHRTSRVFTLNATEGTLRCGDGERGEVFGPLAAIVVTGFVTLASKGNAKASSIVELAATTFNSVLLAGLGAPDLAQLRKVAHNPYPATGGAESDDLDAVAGLANEILHAHQRILDLAQLIQQTTLDQIPKSLVLPLRAPTQAVTALDIERIALDVPGTHVARARAWNNADPALPCLCAPGVVTVVIVPALPVAKPIPSPGLLRTVKRYLDRRRIICTRIEVAPPKYVAVTVTARVQAQNGASLAQIRTMIVAALRSFLDPLIGGPAGLGWPFGRTVYRAEILKIIADVPGVDHVLSLSLAADNGSPKCGDMPICPTWLATSGPHRIEVIG